MLKNKLINLSQTYEGYINNVKQLLAPDFSKYKYLFIVDYKIK